MTHGKKVFIVGPGFIGWNIIDLLIPEGYSVTGLVHRKEHAEGIKASGATPVMGDLIDQDLISHHTKDADIVFHPAAADHMPSVKAILAGIKDRTQERRETIFIHTSGTSVLDDNARGAFKSSKIYHDDIQAEVDNVPDNAPHQEIDLAIVNTKSSQELQGKAKIAIMSPPLIYGFNPKHARLSIQILTLTRWAIKHGYAAHIVVLLHALEKAGYADALLQNPYFFFETTGDNEPSWKDIADVIGEGMAKAGKIKDKASREMPEELYGDAFGDFNGAVIGLNSRDRVNKLRSLGWKSIEKDWRSSYVEDELPQLLKEEHLDYKGYTGIAAS